MQVQRREFLGRAAALGAAALFPPRAVAAQDGPVTKAIPSSGERTPVIGITTSGDGQYAQMEAIMRRERLDFIQVVYAVSNRRAGERLLPLAAARGRLPDAAMRRTMERFFDGVGDG